MPFLSEDEVAEWLRRWTANPMCSARVGSNPILVGSFFFHFFLKSKIVFLSIAFFSAIDNHLLFLIYCCGL